MHIKTEKDGIIDVTTPKNAFFFMAVIQKETE